MDTLPEWKKADSSALDIQAALVLCPEVSKVKLDVPLREQLVANQCQILDSAHRSRSELVAALLNVASEGHVACETQSEPATTSPVLLEDFYALGYAVLQVQILARKLRYSWNIDWIMFTEQVLSAAKASMASDIEETERWLQVSFDSLSQERDRYCSQQAYLLDVVLLATTTMGPSLDRQLECQHPFNLIATSPLLSSLKDKNPNAMETLSRRLTNHECSLVGGLEFERPHAYLSASSIVREFSSGLNSYLERGFPVPKVFTRYQPGFLASSPTWISQFGYTGTLLAAWSGGAIPDKDQAKIRWQANSDGRSVDTVLGHVLDAASVDSYIDLAIKLSGQLDYHHIPTIIFAHWPGMRSAAWDDLLRVLARTPALGKFHTAEEYFATTTQPYSSDSFPSNTFKVPVPSSASEQQHLHAKLIGYEQIRSRAERLWSLHHLWSNVANRNRSSEANLISEQNEIADLLGQVNAWYDGASPPNGLDARISQSKKRLMERIVRALSGSKESATESDSQAASHRYLIVNPSNHPQRVFLRDVPGEVDAASSTRIFATECVSGKSRAVVDVPSFGFVRFQSRKSSNQSHANMGSKPSFWKRVAGARSGIAQSDWTLANEFMEIQIDPKRGHLRSLFVANKRGSHLSGMASLVRGPADVQRKWDDTDCLELTDVRLKVVETSSLLGIIEVSGVCKNADGSVAKLTTRYTLWKGARWVDVEVKAENLNVNTIGCVWRTAWQNEASSISAWYQGIKGKLQWPLQGTVELIEIDDADHRIYFAPVGLSAHRRFGNRFLISHFPISDTGSVAARFAIGLDWPRPYETAMDQCDEPWLIEEGSKFASNQPDEGAWLAQCSLSNVNMAWDNVAPTLDPNRLPESDREVWTGQQADACVWLRETKGKFGTAKISFFQNVAQAWRVDCQGREFDTLTIVDGQIEVAVQAHEQSRILLCWETTEAKAT